jgi:protein involved in polysaccharide export with SLBB domain
MKAKRSSAGRGLVFFILVWTALLIVGCQAPTYEPLPQGVPSPEQMMGRYDKFRIGDSVVINYSGIVGGDPILQPHQETIKEDGKIYLPLVGPIVAMGRTPVDLQKELQAAYANYYRNLTVTVLSATRYYYVSGEVRKPGPQIYLSATDIVKAISAAGDFTDFSNRHRVRIIRANGDTEVVNVQKILDGRADDVPIYPGDKIVVRRRFF